MKFRLRLRFPPTRDFCRKYSKTYWAMLLSTQRQGRVVVSAREENGKVTCVVRDNGAGIPLEMLAKVFDKLATDPAKDGRGLGLAIVKQIVEAHGGSVSVESTHGSGATFSFTIPPARQS